MNLPIRTLSVVATMLALGTSVASGQRAPSPRPHAGTPLLAALGTATIECLGTVGPSSFSTATGALARTFDACQTRDARSLARIDALLGVQFSAQGRADDLAGYYVATWNAFTESFPYGRIQTCPTWTLMNVIDAPTTESVARYVSRGWVGKENRRYLVSSGDCGRSGQCAVTEAVICAGGFGQGFVVHRDPGRRLVEVDPAWWLTTYEYPSSGGGGADECNPFRGVGEYLHGFCENDQATLYGSIERAGEQCCFWSEEAQKVYVDGTFVPVDCGGGWFCMTYCTNQ